MRNPDGTFTHKCVDCPESFNTGMQLRMHIGHKHKSDNNEAEVATKYGE